MNKVYVHPTAVVDKTAIIGDGTKVWHFVHIRENAEIGVLITLEEPTKPMDIEATNAGFYYSPHYDKKYPKIQILTITELLNGKFIDSPRLKRSNVVQKATRISKLKQKKL